MADKPLSQKEKDAAKEIFEALDGDGDGKIDHDDMKQAMANAGYKMSDEEVDAIIGLADADNSGTVSWAEFLKVVERRPIRRRVEAALRKLFEAMDTDGSGYITLDDLKNLVKEAGYEDEISDDQLKDLMDKLDEGGDGKVSFEDFMGAFLE